MQTTWDIVKQMKRSVIAFVIALALGLLSMGALGMLLYYPVAWVLPSRYPPASDWHGDWVWPTMIGVGMAWSFAFVAAGALNRKLVAKVQSVLVRRVAYVAVLWLVALLVWGVALAGAPFDVTP